LSSTVSGALGQVRVDAEGDGDVVHLAVGEQAAGIDLPGVEHLAAQRQDRLHFLVAPRFRRATGRVALDEEDLVAAMSSLWQSESLPGRMATPDCLLLLDLLPGARTRLRGLDGQFGDLLGRRPGVR
jgi:hypothetical protein